MAAVDLRPDTELGDFRVEALIGDGGTSRVYRARQLSLDRLVALKVLDPVLAADTDYVERFRREAAVSRDLEHPAVLPIYGAGEQDGMLYLATRLVDGPSLAQVLDGGPLAPRRALDVIGRVAEALDHSHGRGVIHRDVKAGNVLLDGEGRAYLADFGIAKATGTDRTVAGRYFGTPRSMAPEQAAGSAGFRADLYSLACLAFETLTGRPPFEETEPAALLLAHAHAEVPSAHELRPDLPPAVDDVLRRGMAKRPGDRFPSGKEFVDALAVALASTRSRRRVGTASAARVGRVAAIVAVVGLALIGLAVIVALVVMWPGATQGTTPTAAPTTSPAAGPALQTAADLSAVPRGPRIYEAPLNGTAAGFADVPGSVTGPREAIRHVPGALELEAVQPGGETYSQLDLDRGVNTYLGEMEIAVRPGSDVEFCWSLRWAEPGELATYFCANTLDGRAGFSVFRRGEGKNPIGPTIVLEGIPAGRRVALAVTVQRDRYALYADGRRVLDVIDDQVPVSRTIPGIEVESTTGTGLVRVDGLRLSQLAGA